MKELQIFPECDGHIESILIGCRRAKVSFQTWDAKKLVLIYEEVESVTENNSVFADIAEYTRESLGEGYAKHGFWDVNGNLVLCLTAKALKIFEVGEGADNQAALFDVGYDYIGNQHVPAPPK